MLRKAISMSLLLIQVDNVLWHFGPAPRNEWFFLNLQQSEQIRLELV